MKAFGRLAGRETRSEWCGEAVKKRKRESDSRGVEKDRDSEGKWKREG